MDTGSETNQRRQANREKAVVAISSLVAALALTLMKIVVGVATNSLGILSEAAHSALDLVAAGVTLWAVRVSAKPPDREHTYGHGKFENLSALFETLLLLVTCVWIIYEVGRRLLGAEEVHVEANLWAFGVILVSIVIDFSRSRALSRAAKKHNSQALEADALHFSTDIWSSLVVLLGLFGVLAAERFGLSWLTKADTVAAFGVAVIVVWISLKLGKKSVDDLLDRVPRDLPEKVRAAVAGVPGVEQVTQVRVRRSGPEVFADVIIGVRRVAAFEGAHQIASQAEAAIREALPQASAVVHTEPVAGDHEDLATVVQLVAARQGLGAHSIRIYDEQQSWSLDLHLEVDGTLQLDEAHRQVTEFEQTLRQALPEMTRIVSHIEPRDDAAPARQATVSGQAEVELAVREFIETHPIAVHPHDITALWAGGQLSVSLHCTLDAATSVTDAHDFSERLENHLRVRLPAVGRVVIHVEPAEPPSPISTDTNNH